MDITGIIKTRILLFILLAGILIVVFSIIYYKLNVSDNGFFFSGIVLFFISIASILENFITSTILKNIHNKNKSSIHLYASTKAFRVPGISLISLLLISTLISICYYLDEGSNNWLVLLFGSSLSLLNVSFLIDTGRIVFINDEYILYHQGVYKKVISYQNADASIICIVEDDKKQQKKALIKFKSEENKNKVIEDFIKNGLKEAYE